MASAKEIKRKISSIKNTGKITKAMELISTVKMKKAQDKAMTKKDFVLEVLKIFLRIQDSLPEAHPLFAWTEAKDTLGVIITSNKGLCGGYNINVMKQVNKYMNEENIKSMDFIALGKRGARFVARTGNNLVSDYSTLLSDNIEPIMVKSIAKELREQYISGKYKKVVVFYTHYINTIRQIAVAREFLPIIPKDIEDYLFTILGEELDMDKILGTEDKLFGYQIEPSKEEIIEEVIPMILDMMFYDMILEAKASEHSARMIAMKNAKDNAKKIAESLTLKYNKARQAMITKEVSEITGGVEALKDM